jgi:serine/threonine-protein kinase
MVAVKYLRKGLLEDDQVVQRFLQEAQLVARFRHAGILPVHGLGRGPGGGYFIAMDWSPGTDLAGRLESGPRPTSAEIVRWMIEASGAVGYSCGQGVIHCDLKPENLLLGEDGHLRVTDYGLAHLLVDDQPIHAGRLAGTAPYMAPEQVSSRWGTVGPWTDVYGLGGVMLKLLTGQAPYTEGDLPAILSQVVSPKPLDLENRDWAGTSSELKSLCLRCLQKDPTERFADPNLLTIELQRLTAPDSECV